MTVRLNPKLHYLAELAARQQRRTLSSFIEWATEESLQYVTIEERWHLATRTADKRSTVADIAREVWEVDEIDRFFKLVLRYPHLLTHEEQVLWKLIRENAYLWYGCGDLEAPATVAAGEADDRVIYIPQAKAGAREQPITAHLASFLEQYLAALPA